MSEPARLGRSALIAGVLGLALACIPYADLAAALPGLAAVVLGVLGLVTGRQRIRALVGLVLGVLTLLVSLILVLVLVAAETGQVSAVPIPSGGAGSEPLPSSAPLPSAGVGGVRSQSLGAHRVVYRITGSGSARVTVSSTAGGTAFLPKIAVRTLPYRLVERYTSSAANPDADLEVDAVGQGAGTVGCTITVDGVVAASDASDTGFVLCTVEFR